MTGGGAALEAGAVDFDTAIFVRGSAPPPSLRSSPASAISAMGNGCVCDNPASAIGSVAGGGGVNIGGRILGGLPSENDGGGVTSAGGGMDGRRVGGGSFGALITSPLFDNPASGAVRSEASRPGNPRRSLVSSSSRSSASSGSSVSSSSISPGAPAARPCSPSPPPALISWRRPSAASGLGLGCDTFAGGGGGGGPTYDPDVDAGVDAGNVDG